MFQSITFNGTDKKQIGIPILRRTNEMIYEFDLQYERNYKIVKVVSQRELDFQAYLKQQEALQFRLENLIKILREYFKENNYNDNSYYILFKNPKTNTNPRRRRKKRKKMRPKTAEIKRNKFLFYKITKNNYFFIKFKPYLFPLTNKEKKEFERKIYTDVNLKEKETSKLYNMTPAQLKKFVDVFGFLPVTLRKDDEDKDKNIKILKNRNFSSYNIFRNKKSYSLGNKTYINLKKRGKKMFVKQESNLNNYNNINNTNAYNNLINNFKLQLSNSMNLKNNKNNKNNIDLYNNKYFNKNSKNNNNNNMNNNIFNQFFSNTLGINPQANHNYNNYFNILNNRYFNLKQYNLNNMRLNSGKMTNNYNYNFLYNNYNSLNNINSSKNNIFFTNNKNKNNINNDINKSNDDKIKIQKNINLENIKNHSFTNQCIRTIQKSEILNKDIKFLNKEYDLSGQNFNIKRNKIENKSLQKVNHLSFMQIYEKDFMPDIKKQFEQKYEHIKEDNKGRIQVKKIEFNRKPKSKLNFVRIYNKRRDQKRLNKIEFVYNNNDEEKSDLTAYKMKRSLSNVKLSRNHLSKKHISSK